MREHPNTQHFRHVSLEEVLREKYDDPKTLREKHSCRDLILFVQKYTTKNFIHR